MELDKNQDSGNTTHTPQTHTRGVDPTPDFSSLAPPKAGGDNMDHGPPNSIPSPDTATPLSCRLHGFPETSPLERVPSNNQDTHSRKVPGCAIVRPHPSHLHQICYSRFQNQYATVRLWKVNNPRPQGLTKPGDHAMYSMIQRDQ